VGRSADAERRVVHGPKLLALWVTRSLGPVPLARLTTVHALASAADAFFTVSLAGSLFFSVSVGAARPRIIAYLLVTLAPFLVLAPLVAPLIDRFARAQRLVAAATCAARGVLCLFVAADLRNLLLYPEVFGMLVFDKAYSVTKSALVPGLVSQDADLVAANARLSRVSTVTSLIAGATAAGLLEATNSVPVLRIAALLHFAAAFAALRLPSDDPARLPPAERELEELRSRSVRYAAGAMCTLRSAVGFLVFLVVFGLKRTGQPLWFFGVVAAASIVGNLAGAAAGPLLRRRLDRAEPLLTFALGGAALASLVTAWHATRASEVAAVLVIALAANMGRQCFDSVLQRDAPHAAFGRSFAWFETIFQLTWVGGALVAVVLEPTTTAGLAALGGAFALTAVAYGVGVRRALPIPSRP
jgi:hypothetical protein